MKMCDYDDCRQHLAEADRQTCLLLHRTYVRCIARYPRGVVRQIVSDYLTLHRYGDPWLGCWRD